MGLRHDGAGEEAVREVWQVWEERGAALALFWSAHEIPDEVGRYLTWQQAGVWRVAVHDPRSLMRLAGNPYLLLMLTRIFQATGELPANRAALFDRFVEILLVWERLAAIEDGAIRPTPQGETLLSSRWTSSPGRFRRGRVAPGAATCRPPWGERQPSIF